VTRVAVRASWVAIIWYGGSLLLIALGPSDPAVGLIGVIAWLLAMPFALLVAVVAVVAGLALASDGRAALKAGAFGFGVFAAGVGISIALVAAVPNQN
jgi:hypothetical protein